MKLGTGIGGWPDTAGAQAIRAEENGYDFVSCGELAHDSILTMALAASRTERVGLHTSVTIAFPRSPMVLAMEAWDIQRLSRGRFCIGLGSQVKGHNERRFGGTWSAAAPRMKEYIQMMKAIWDSWQNGTPADFIGKHYRYTLMTPNFNPGPIDFPKPKIYLAVVGPAMARVAGEVAVFVVDAFEMIDVEYQTHERRLLAPTTCELFSEPGLEVAPVVPARQRVGEAALNQPGAVDGALETEGRHAGEVAEKVGCMRCGEAIGIVAREMQAAGDARAPDERQQRHARERGRAREQMSVRGL